MGFLSQEQINVDLFDEVKKLKKEVGNYREAHKGFLNEFAFEYGWETQNAVGGGQWHKGAKRGFEHVKEIFDKHFDFNETKE